MNFCVKNELKTLLDSVRFAVSSCLENDTETRIDHDRMAGVSISLSGKVVSGRSFEFAGKVHSGAFYSIVPAVQKIYNVVESLAADLVTVVGSLIRKRLPVISGCGRIVKNYISKKVLFKRQAVLACAGGLRL